ncbi:MAG: hypothetical protein H6698_01510 [Myxococcales bacterium]|nr:hypothetical protein [Myxococcales bacterium]MCB9531077.1 hypothetical protein [Myxococcales bacterium]MCB9532987.1 hypothetical protein [Myxococcales bacterium]
MARDRNTPEALVAQALDLARRGLTSDASEALSAALEAEFIPSIAQCAATVEAAIEAGEGAEAIATVIAELVDMLAPPADDIEILVELDAESGEYLTLSEVVDASPERPGADRREAASADATPFTRLPEEPSSQSTTRPVPVTRNDAFQTAPRAPVEGHPRGRTAELVRELFDRADPAAGRPSAATPIAPEPDVRNLAVTAEADAVDGTAPSPGRGAAPYAGRRAGRAALDDDDDFDFGESLGVASSHLEIEPEVVRADARVATPIDTEVAPAAPTRPVGREPMPPATQPAPRPRAAPAALTAAQVATPPQAMPAVATAQTVKTGKFQPVAASPSRLVVPAAELIERVKIMLGKGDLASADQLVRDVLASEPGNAEALRLQRDIVAKLSMLKMASLQPLDRVPRADLGAVAGASLNPRSMFLLSQVDGTSTLQDIIDMSGMSAGDAADQLAELIAKGVLRF